MDHQVPDQIKAERSDILLAMAARNKKAFEEAQLGREKEVLMEEELRGRKLVCGTYQRIYQNCSLF